jgi:hypothetical protein
MKYLSLKYTIFYMKTYILASFIPSRISAKLNYLHIINTYVDCLALQKQQYRWYIKLLPRPHMLL